MNNMNNIPIISKSESVIITGYLYDDTKFIQITTPNELKLFDYNFSKLEILYNNEIIISLMDEFIINSIRYWMKSGIIVPLTINNNSLKPGDNINITTHYYL